MLTRARAASIGIVMGLVSLAIASPGAAQTGRVVYSATDRLPTAPLTIYNAGVDTATLEPRTAYQMCYVYAPGSTQFRLDNLSVGIGRVPRVDFNTGETVPAPAVTVEIQVLEMVWSDTATPNMTRGSVIASFTRDLAEEPTETTTVVENSWEDLDPAQRPIIPLQTASDGLNGYGSFWVSLRFIGPDAAKTVQTGTTATTVLFLNGWNRVNEPAVGRSQNRFGRLSGTTWGLFFFGNDTSNRPNPARFETVVSGSPIGEIPPTGLVFGNACQSGSWFMPPADPSSAPNSLWAYQGCFVDIASTTSAWTFKPSRLTVGINRYGNGTNGAAPAVGVEVALVQMTIDPAGTLGLGDVVATRAFELNPSTKFFSEWLNVDFSSGDSPSCVLANGILGDAPVGGFWIGVRFTGPNAANTLNGWRIAYAPEVGRTLNAFGMAESTGGNFGLWGFGTYSLLSGDPPLAQTSRFAALASGSVTAPPPPCPADLNNNGIVNGDDLGILLTAWGPCPTEGACPADLNNNGIVNGDDLGILLTAWGACPN